MRKAAMDAIQEALNEQAKDKKVLEQIAKDHPALAGMTAEQIKNLLIEKGGYTEEKLKKVPLSDRRIAAIKLLLSGGQSGGAANDPFQEAQAKAKAKEQIKMRKFRDILQQIFAKEAYKLHNGLSYYGRIDVSNPASLPLSYRYAMLRTTMASRADGSIVSAEEAVGALGGPQDADIDEDEDEDMDAMLDKMLQEDAEQEQGDNFEMEAKTDQEEAAELRRLLEEEEDDVMSDAGDDAMSVVSSTSKASAQT